MGSRNTEAALASIDKCFAALAVPTRSTWTTPEIENLLLDLRNEIIYYDTLDRLEADLKRARRRLLP